MKTLMPTFILLLTLSLSLAAQKPIISVFGTLHLHNPGNDKINADVGDVTTPARKAELQEVVDLVSRFKPTKVAIEWETSDTLWSRHYYRAWLAGKLEEVIAPDDEVYLTSETVLLAYPIARAAGLTELHPIDAYTSFPADSAVAWAMANGQQAEIEAFQQAITYGQHVADSLTSLSIGDMLRFCNSKTFAQQLNQDLYLNHFIGMGKGDAYPGSFLVEEWYARNLRIFTNLHRITEPKDRVLIIFGAGHKEILDDLIQDRIDWEWKPGAWLLDQPVD